MKPAAVVLATVLARPGVARRTDDGGPEAARGSGRRA